MKAIVYTQYGPPEVLKVKEVEKPAPNDDQALVRVLAVSVNPAEAHMRGGGGRLFGGGLLKPKESIPGADFAGRVEAVGKNITGFHAGDEIFGRKDPGGLAEYACVSERSIALKPAQATFAQAAAVPVAGVTALQSLRDAGHLQAGQKVLINGAAGGLGTFSVQIAKAFGAVVTGVCSTRNLELVCSLGADYAIDYTKDDLSRSGQRYDLIIDNVGNLPVSAYRRLLTPNGICVITGFTSVFLLLQDFTLGPLFSRTGGQKIGNMLAHIRQPDLVALKELIEAGKLTPFVDKTYPLNQAAEAYRYLETRHARGKIVISMETV